MPKLRIQLGTDNIGSGQYLFHGGLGTSIAGDYWADGATRYIRGGSGFDTNVTASIGTRRGSFWAFIYPKTTNSGTTSGINLLSDGVFAGRASGATLKLGQTRTPFGGAPADHYWTSGEAVRFLEDGWPTWVEFEVPDPTTITASAGSDKTVASGGIVTLDGSATVKNGVGNTTYAWTKISGTGGTLSSSTVAKPRFTAPTLSPGAANRTIVYELKATNNSVTSAGDRVTITVRAPAATTVTADAGSNKTVASGGTATLNGSASVTNARGVTTFLWRKISGTGGALSSTTVDEPTFTAPTLTPGSANRTIVYGLKATNNGVTSAEDTVSITVTAPQTTVTADAGSDKSVDSAGTVTLNGSATVVNGSGATTWAWRKISGTGGALSSSTAQEPTFTAPTLSPGAADRTIVYGLRATNNSVRSAEDRVSIRVRAPGATTVNANAGSDKTVASAGTVRLDGSASVENGVGNTTYAWTRISGTGGSLNSTTARRPTFTAPTRNPGSANLLIVFELKATNNSVTSAGDRVTITVTAEAGDTTRKGATLYTRIYKGGTRYTRIYKGSTRY